METKDINTPLWEKARSFAVLEHLKVNDKYDGMPYDFHLNEVFSFAKEFIRLIPENHRNTALAACFTHDLIENTQIRYHDIKKELGEPVAEITVALTTDNRAKNRKERMSPEYYNRINTRLVNIFVKLCDRLANVNYSMLSPERNKGHLEMYLKEQEEFKRYLHTEQLDPMFELLDSYFEDYEKKRNTKAVD
jgi:(p)ppGpp synthase/HD superfamily hydrolase